MTLLIAYLLMYSVGGFAWHSYLAVFVLWLLHVGYHS